MPLSHIQVKVFLSTLQKVEGRVFAGSEGFWCCGQAGENVEVPALLLTCCWPQVFCSSSLHWHGWRYCQRSEVTGSSYLQDVQCGIQFGFIDMYRIIHHHYSHGITDSSKSVPGRRSCFVNFLLNLSGSLQVWYQVFLSCYYLFCFFL